MNDRLWNWSMTLLGAGLYFSFTFAWNSLAALIPLVSNDLGLSGIETGIVLGTVAFTIFCTWPIVGPFVERIGPSRAMGAGVILLGFAGMIRSYVDTFPSLVLCMVIISLGGSTVTYGIPSVVSSWFGSDRSGTPLGVVTVGATLGTVVAFDTAPTIVSALGGWRPALLVSGIPAVILGTIFYIGTTEGPNRDGEAEPPTLGEIVGLLRRPEVAPLVLAGGVYLFATHSIYGWLSPLLIERGLPAATSTQLVAIVTAGMIVGGLVIPALADQIRGPAFFVAGGGILFGISITCLAVLPLKFWALAVACFFSGVSIGGISPLLRTLPLGLVPSSVVSTVLGMVFGLGALGGFIGPLIIGATRSIAPTWVGFLIIGAPGLIFVMVASVLIRD